jgi:uncharacterized cofD-like protein
MNGRNSHRLIIQPGEGRVARLRRWMRPGMGLKRWLVVVFLGQLLLAGAGALLLREFFRELGPEGQASPLVSLVLLQPLPAEVRIFVLLAAGIGLFLFGAWRLLGAILEPLGSRDEPLVELIYQKRSLARGPRVVAIGGGTGLSTLLRGLKEATSNITAVVTVADDGGSSGLLRQELGIAPVGDIRNCIAALADAEQVMTRLLQYRFPADPPDLPAPTEPGTELRMAGIRGHSFGNLLIAALSAVEGDFEEGVRQSNRVLAVRGRVVPVAPAPLTLHATLADGSTLDGQSQIARAHGIQRVWIAPDDVEASSEALEAIAAADLIVLGPGSLYTSLLPSLLVPGIRRALLEASAPRVYVCNVATQVGETEGYQLSGHMAALERHEASPFVDVVLVNDDFGARQPAGYPAAPVAIDLPAETDGRRIVRRAIVDPGNAHHHEPARLARALLEILDETPSRRPLATVARTA